MSHPVEILLPYCGQLQQVALYLRSSRAWGLGFRVTCPEVSFGAVRAEHGAALHQLDDIFSGGWKFRLGLTGS